MALTPVALATWIAFCIPGADPDIATALVMAGSGGNPLLVLNKAGQEIDPDALSPGSQEEYYLGLTQIPASRLRNAGIAPQIALNSCVNLSLGWALWSSGHEQAKAKQPTKWKAVSMAYSWYRDGALVLETPFSQKATDLAIKHKPVAPAPFGSRLYHEVAASWANGQALLNRLESAGMPLHRSRALALHTRSTVVD